MLLLANFIVLILLMASLTVLLLTSLPVFLGFTPTITGYSLLAHAGFACVFSVFVVLFALLNAAYYSGDCASCPSNAGSSRVQKIRSACFWIVLASSVMAIGAIAINLFPLFDANTQAYTLWIHRASGLALTASLAGYVYSSIQYLRQL